MLSSQLAMKVGRAGERHDIERSSYANIDGSGIAVTSASARSVEGQCMAFHRQGTATERQRRVYFLPRAHPSDHRGLVVAEGRPDKQQQQQPLLCVYPAGPVGCFLLRVDVSGESGEQRGSLLSVRSLEGKKDEM